MVELRDVPATTGTPPDTAVGYARLTGLLGVAFAVLLTVGLVLVHRSPTLGASDGDDAAFYGDGGRTVPAASAIPYGLQVVSGGLFVALLFAGLLPRWVALLSYLMAAAMLVSTMFHSALLLVFPGWVALAGLIVLARTGRSGVRISPRSRP